MIAFQCALITGSVATDDSNQSVRCRHVTSPGRSSSGPQSPIVQTGLHRQAKPDQVAVGHPVVVAAQTLQWPLQEPQESTQRQSRTLLQDLRNQKVAEERQTRERYQSCAHFRQTIVFGAQILPGRGRKGQIGTVVRFSDNHTRDCAHWLPRA